MKEVVLIISDVDLLNLNTFLGDEANAILANWNEWDKNYSEGFNKITFDWDDFFVNGYKEIHNFISTGLTDKGALCYFGDELEVLERNDIEIHLSYVLNDNKTKESLQ